MLSILVKVDRSRGERPMVRCRTIPSCHRPFRASSCENVATTRVAIRSSGLFPRDRQPSTPHQNTPHTRLRRTCANVSAGLGVEGVSRAFKVLFPFPRPRNIDISLHLPPSTSFSSFNFTKGNLSEPRTLRTDPRSWIGGASFRKLGSVPCRSK